MLPDSEMHQIIDCLNPEYFPVTDELQIEEHDTYGKFIRSFKKGDRVIDIQWRVEYGTPQTVKTVFEKWRQS
jgi:hypothetical protein